MPAARRAAQESDLRSQPAYGLAEAARYVKLPTATLRSWVMGRAYPTAAGEGRFKPIIHPAGSNPLLVSFWNLIEAHVLRALRTEHGISIKEVRQAIHFAERQLGIERLLLRKELCTQAGMLFLDRYGDLINLSKSGQLAMRQVLEQHLKRVEWDEWKFPVRLYPFVSPDGATSEKPIAIDPAIAFGRPVVVRAGVSTAAVAERVDAGERLEDIAEDYGLTVPEVEQAVVFERAA